MLSTRQLGAHDLRVRTGVGWGPEQKTFEWLASVRRMRDRRTSHGSLAPLPIFPLDPQVIADLMIGRLEMRTMMRGDVLEQDFAAHGIDAEVEYGDDRDDVFLRVARGPVSLVIPPNLRERLLFELLTPESMIEVIAGTLNLLAAGRHGRLDILPTEDEAGLWA